MTDFDITIASTASPEDQAALEAALNEFNFATTGYRDGRSLSCFLRDDNGTLRAGVDGFTWGGYARVVTLWVDESLRGHGLGRRLLAAAEDEARRRGCRTIILDTHDFQAPEFYKKLGYRVCGIFEDIGGRYNRYFLSKKLG